MERYVKLAVAVAGIYTCYLSYGIFQEELYRKSEDGTRFSATAFVLFVQCVTNAVIALVGHILSSAVSSTPQAAAAKHVDAPPVQSWWWTLLDRSVVATSIVYVLAMYTSNEALAFVPYTTQALVKSCKMIPVLVGSIIIARKRYSLVKYLAVLMMTAGITWFQFAGAGSKHKPAVPKPGAAAGDSASIIAAVGPEAFGMLLLCVSLCLDGITGPTQELLKRLKLTNTQQMLGNNVWASLVMLGIATALGQVQPAVSRRDKRITQPPLAMHAHAGHAPCACPASSLTIMINIVIMMLPAGGVPVVAPPPAQVAGPLLPLLRVWPDLHLLDDPHVRLPDAVHDHHHPQVLHDRHVGLLLQEPDDDGPVGGGGRRLCGPRPGDAV